MNLRLHPKLPNTLYKYYPPPSAEIRYAEENLETRLKYGRIRLTDALEVNDLFESDPVINWNATSDDVYRKVLQVYDADLSVQPHHAENQRALRQQYPSKAILQRHKPKLYRSIKGIQSSIAQSTFKLAPFYCLSEDCRAVLMWSHYAANHKGICIGYDTKGFEFPGLAMPINYQKERIRVDVTDLFFYDEIPDHSDLIFKILRTKSVDWNYEKEWRFFGVKFGEGEVYRAGFEFPFDRTKIKEIIFGERATDETVEKVKSYVGDLSPFPMFYRAVKSASHYSIDLQSI